MTRYLARKITIYLLTFVVAVTIDWAIPRLMPGDPIDGLISRINTDPTASAQRHGFFTKSFELDQPLWKQYVNFWWGLLHGDLGPSIAYVGSRVSDLIWAALPYTLALLVPAIVLSYIAGNRAGALAVPEEARQHRAARRIHPHRDALVFLALLLAYFVAFQWELLPVSGAYDFSLQPAWTWEFARSFLAHWILPFLSLFLVSFGGWAIGMRNLIIYELEAGYANYLQALGAPNRLVRKYAYSNAVLPQMTGLALALGVIVGGAARHGDRLRLPRRRVSPPDGHPEPRLLPAARDLPFHHHRCPRRQLRGGTCCTSSSTRGREPACRGSSDRARSPHRECLDRHCRDLRSS